MYAGAGNQFVGRFMGYLHRPDPFARDRAEHQEFDGNARPLPDDLPPPLPEDPTLPELEEFPTYGRAFVFRPEPDPVLDLRPITFPDAPIAAPPFDPNKLIPLPLKPPIPPAGGGGGGLGDNATYDPAGDDKMVNADQTNFLLDDDTFSNRPADLGFLANYNPIDLWVAMALGREFFPGDLPAGESNEVEMMAWATARTGEEAAQHEEAGYIQPLAEGRYFNGETLADDAPAVTADNPISERPKIAEPTPYEQGVTDTGQVLEMGGNYAENVAQIIDVTGATPTMLVMGDWYETNAIYQINVWSDLDEVLRFGPAGAIVETGGNVADNYASLDETNPFAELDLPNFAGFFIHVDQVDGDYYDIKLLTQTNWIRDNDVAVQTSFTSYSLVDTGLNEQGNYFAFADAFENYDIVIIGGNFHSANLIYQINVILDNDWILVSAGEDSGADQSIYGGQNWLFNSATIRDMGIDDPEAMNAALAKMCEQIGNGDSRVDLDAAHLLLPGNGSMGLNILYISGDYFDINVISQVNVIVDEDTAVQCLPEGTITGTDGFVQYTATGNNAATNTAEIITANAVDGIYVDGEHYEDAILIQANIVVTDPDQVATNDPDGLLPEIVAFTGDHPVHPEHPAHPAPDQAQWDTTPAAQHSDVLGSLLT